MLLVAHNAWGDDHKQIRDPFFLPSKRVVVADFNNIFLLGVIKSGKKIGALIKHGDEQKIVFKGDELQGYTVDTIAMDRVVIIRGKKKLEIPMKSYGGGGT